MKVVVRSTGCRLNQCESDLIRSQFISAGYENTRDNADVCVVNTCTVTRQADVKTLKLIKRMCRENPHARIIATGCMVETNKNELEGLNLVHSFVAHRDKFRILKGQAGETPEYQPLRTRPFIKIQDGCDFSCSYCKVRRARGKSRSEDLDWILRTAQTLSEKKFHEIVLTGVNIGDYRHKGRRLSDLLRHLIGIEGLEMIRLSSIEPASMDEDLLSVLTSEKICRYFHIPLQSGSPRILRLMNRPYSPADYAELIRKIRSNAGNAIIGTDIIVGFPGETEEDFQETFEFLKKNDIFYLHVFRYSPREETPALLLPGAVQEGIKTKRAKILLDFMRQRKEELFQGLIHKRIKVLIENKIKYGEYISSVSPHYLKVLLPLTAYKTRIGQIQEVQVIKIIKGEIYGV